jgi:hypothetical protein
LAWNARSSLAQVTVTDVTRGTVLRAFTVGTVVRFDRLAELDVPRLEPGPHLLELTTWSTSTTDAVTSSDAPERRRHEDRSHAGASTFLRVPFQVTP